MEPDYNIGIKVASDTIKLESEAIAKLESTILSTEFAKTLKVLFNCKGRLVVTGIGKSAIIAQKITATLNSTGTPALYMHAGDAVHGDLGIITPEDIIICLSKSGGTPEIRTLVSFIKQMGNTLIAITANSISYLAEESNFVLITPVEREADPNNLAPTTSSTAQLALGDALAMALMALNGFNDRDFARFHPGGALGKQLLLTVNEFIKNHEKPKVQTNSDIQTVIIEISTKRMGATAVVNDKGQLTGIVTDGDLRRMLQSHTDWQHLSVVNIMTPNPKSISSKSLATEALQIMRKYSITQLPVLEDGTYCGMIHIHDIIREGIVS